MEKQNLSAEKQESHESSLMGSGFESSGTMPTMTPPPLQLFAGDGFGPPPSSQNQASGTTSPTGGENSVTQLRTTGGSGGVMQLKKTTELTPTQREHVDSESFVKFLIGKARRDKLELGKILGFSGTPTKGKITEGIQGILAQAEGDLDDRIISILDKYIASQGSQPQPQAMAGPDPFAGRGMATETAPLPASRTIEQGPNLVTTNIPSGINGFFDLIIYPKIDSVYAIVKIHFKGFVGDEQWEALKEVQKFWNANVRFQHRKTYKTVRLNLRIQPIPPPKLNSPQTSHYGVEFLDDNKTNASVQRDQRQILIRTPETDTQLGNSQPSAFHEFGHAFGLHEEYGLQENLGDSTHHKGMWKQGKDELEALKQGGSNEDPNSIMGTGMNIFPRHFAPLLQQYCALANAGSADDWDILINDMPETLPDTGSGPSGGDDSHGDSSDKNEKPGDKSSGEGGQNFGMGPKKGGGSSLEGGTSHSQTESGIQDSETQELHHNGTKLVTPHGRFLANDSRSGSPGDARCFWDSLRAMGINDQALQTAAQNAGVDHNNWFNLDHLQDFINALSTELRRPITLILYRAAYQGGVAIQQTVQGVPQLGVGVQAYPGATFALAVFSIADQPQGHFVPKQ